MQHLPEGIEGDDIDQWLRGGYIVVDGECVRYRHYMDGCIYYTKLMDDNNTTYAHVEDVLTHWPMCGAVNLRNKPFAVVCKRQQSRQWRRTFSVREISVAIPNEWELIASVRTVDIRNSMCGDELAMACFAPEYPPVSDAIGMLNTRMKYSVAISPHVILAGTDETQKRVYLKGELVAVINAYKVVPISDNRKARRVLKTLGGRYAL